MYAVKSYQIAQTINIKAVNNHVNGQLLFSDSDELFFKLADKQYLYIFQFGIVSFFNATKTDIEEVIQQIYPFGKGVVQNSLSEDTTVVVEMDTLEVTFDNVKIPNYNVEMIRLIMLHTSQSVALDRYAVVTEKLLEETSTYTLTLEQKGKLFISRRKLKKLIGKIMNIKNGIYENLYIFDSPEVAWQDEQMGKLDALLKNTFDLKDRYRNIQDRISIIKENLELFKDIWDHKESSTLEWIIILLIFVEIIDLFVTKIL
jgi:uncharacterized Rmd1/YagE family protein